MNHLLKRINTDHYVVVDDSKIKLGDWVCFTNKSDVTYKQITQTEVNNSYHGVQKITHSSEPIEEKDRTFMSVTFGWDKIQRLDLSYIKSLFGEVDVVELSKNETKGRVFANGVHEEVVAQMFYRKGYNQCLEDNKDKKFTEEDIERAIKYGIGVGNLDLNANLAVSTFMLSLTQPKDTWECEFIDGQLKLK